MTRATTPPTIAIPVDSDHGIGYAKPPIPVKKRPWWDIYGPPMFITIILIVAHWKFGILEKNYWRTASAIGTAILTEIILSWLLIGKIPHLASSYISGISVGILVRSSYFWPFPLCAAVSIASKYAFRLGSKHLWNPSNFGVSILLFTAPWAYTSLSLHWGNNYAPMVVIWCLGLAITYRVRRVHMSATYALSFVFFAFIRSILGYTNFKVEVAPITGPMYMLYTFFMVTDPKTTVKPRWAQYVFVVSVAAMECLLRMQYKWHATTSPNYELWDSIAIKAPYYALFIVGPTFNILEYLLTSAKKTNEAKVALQPA